MEKKRKKKRLKKKKKSLSTAQFGNPRKAKTKFTLKLSWSNPETVIGPLRVQESEDLN